MTDTEPSTKTTTSINGISIIITLPKLLTVLGALLVGVWGIVEFKFSDLERAETRITNVSNNLVKAQRGLTQSISSNQTLVQLNKQALQTNKENNKAFYNTVSEEIAQMNKGVSELAEMATNIRDSDERLIFAGLPVDERTSNFFGAGGAIDFWSGIPSFVEYIKLGTRKEAIFFVESELYSQTIDEARVEAKTLFSLRSEINEDEFEVLINPLIEVRSNGQYYLKLEMFTAHIQQPE